MGRQEDRLGGKTPDLHFAIEIDEKMTDDR